MTIFTAYFCLFFFFFVFNLKNIAYSKWNVHFNNNYFCEKVFFSQTIVVK